MRKILITGATGLVGRHLVERLVDDSHIVVVGRNNPNLENVEWIEHDLSQPFNPNCSQKDIDTLIYMAQSQYFREFPHKALDIFHVNTVSMLYFLNYAREIGVRNFVYASSGGVYGHGGDGFSEDIEIPASGNLGFYLSTKLCSEILAENYRQYMNVVLLRFFFLYGKGQKRSMLIPRLVDNIRAGNPITLQGEDGILINPTHVSDAVEAINASLTLNKGGIFNIGGPDILSLREICNVIGNRVGKIPHFEIDMNKKPNNLIGDISKMKRYLWNPGVNFERGIDTVL
jgi:nucleoside-diphosphate-sugar epimerase